MLNMSQLPFPGVKGGTKIVSLTEDLSLDWDKAIPRDDKSLVKIVETLRGEADGAFAELHVVKIPNGVKWRIEEYDGQEHIAEQHRTWYAK